MRLNLGRVLCTFMIGVALAASARAAPITIDDFSVPSGSNQTAQTAGNTTGVFNGLNGIATAHTIGGVRELYAKNNSGANLANPSNRYSTSAGFLVGGFGNPSGAGFGVGSFNYDGVKNSTGATKGTVGTGLGNVDLTGGGTNTGIIFKDWSVVGTVRMTVTLNTLTGNLTSVHNGSASDPGSFTLSFASDFTGVGNLTKVRGIQFFFEVLNGTHNAGSDVGFSTIVAGAVPEPSSILMGLVGVIGMVSLARRKR